MYVMYKSLIKFNLSYTITSSQSLCEFVACNFSNDIREFFYPSYQEILITAFHIFSLIFFDSKTRLCDLEYTDMESVIISLPKNVGSEYRTN